MYYRVLLLFISWVIMYYPLHAQKIFFTENLSLSQALQRAKMENKNVLIDTYADWCIPCKKMEVEFQIDEISNFFNKNYVNIRINMDNYMISGEYKHKFEIVFLPTIILLDPDGNVKYITDKFISGRELKTIAEKAMDPAVYFLSDASAVSTSPISGQSSGNGVSKAPEKTLYTSGDANPEYLMKEAYFRIELMDGSEKAAAQRYLATQKDWTTPQNIKFIFDFLSGSRTPEFDFFGKHLNLFKKEIGADIATQTLDIFVENELSVGFPRPDYDRARLLYSYTDSLTADVKAFKYYTERLLTECRFGEYEKFVTTYLIDHPERMNSDIYFNLADRCINEENPLPSEIKKCQKYNDIAINLDTETLPIYYEQAAILYLKNGDKKNAKKALKKAINIAEDKGMSFKMKDVIQRMIEDL